MHKVNNSASFIAFQGLLVWNISAFFCAVLWASSILLWSCSLNLFWTNYPLLKSGNIFIRHLHGTYVYRLNPWKACWIRQASVRKSMKSTLSLTIFWFHELEVRIQNNHFQLSNPLLKTMTFWIIQPNRSLQRESLLYVSATGVSQCNLWKGRRAADEDRRLGMNGVNQWSWFHFWACKKWQNLK